MKKCNLCGEDKDESEYYRRTGGKLYGHCITCHKGMRRDPKAFDPAIIPDEKFCRVCEQIKPSAGFSIHRTTADGLQAYCKPCTAELARARRFGLTVDQLRELVRAAEGRCAICREEADLMVDHCHETGKVRGMLCHHCNLVLGHARDDVKVLAACVAYLTL